MNRSGTHLASYSYTKEYVGGITVRTITAVPVMRLSARDSGVQGGGVDGGGFRHPPDPYMEVRIQSKN